MRVRLDKETVLRLYCSCREAERSVHRALADPWPEFRAYYGAEKRAEIAGLIERAGPLLGRLGPCPTPPADEEIEWLSTALGYFFRACFGRWLARWEKRWSFDQKEVCYLAATLARLLRLLDNTEKPAPQTLIELRRTFFLCSRVIGRRCHGLRELKLAARIDHFHKTEWLPRVTLADVLKKSA